MRIRATASALAGLAMLASACHQGGHTPAAAQASPLIAPSTFASVTLSVASDDAWLHGSSSLQAPVSAYVMAWGRALGHKVPGFSADAGVAALTDSDPPDALCENKRIVFDAHGKQIHYCRASHEGPDAFGQAGMILVPYQPYAVALSGAGTQEQQRQGTALLMARAYFWHVVSELQAGNAVSSRVISQFDHNADCVVGLTLHSFIPSMNEQQWTDAITFVSGFTVDWLGAPDRQTLLEGYNAAGRLQACLK